mgnify:CR=1 FL=1
MTVRYCKKHDIKKMPTVVGTLLKLDCEDLKLELRHCLDALCTGTLLHVLPTFKNANALDIWVELAARRPHREAALITKLRLLPAEFTDRHFSASILNSTYKPVGDATIALLQKQGRATALIDQIPYREVSR